MNGHWEAGEGHQGIDILGPVGIPVLAPAAGQVSDSWFGPMYGHQILIDHGQGPDGRYIRTRLVHLDARSVESGNQVARGQPIGALGRTGQLLRARPDLPGAAVPNHLPRPLRRGSLGVNGAAIAGG